MMDLHAATDFDSIVDGLEPVTVFRRCGESLAISQARRITKAYPSAASTDARFPSEATAWEFLWPEDTPPLAPGDTIRSSDDSIGIVLSTQWLRPGRRVRCEVLSNFLKQTPTVLIQIQQAIWQDVGSGPEFVRWEAVRSAVPAVIRAVATEVDHSVSPSTSDKTFLIGLAVDVEIDHEHRLVDPNGLIYRVDKLIHDDAAQAFSIVNAKLVNEPE